MYSDVRQSLSENKPQLGLRTASIRQCYNTAKTRTIKKGLAKNHLLQNIYYCADKKRIVSSRANNFTVEKGMDFH